MPLLIDGYNLLHVTGIFGQGTKLTELHRSREALLAFLAAAIEPAERTHTTIVFDASGAPPGLPRSIEREGITVHFARDFADADTMLEELIAAHATPRKLVVVSSDHRVQRAARRRRAIAVDSDCWYAELCTKLRQRRVEPPNLPQKPVGQLTTDEVDYWLMQFGEETEVDNKDRGSTHAQSQDFDNPFPPDYGDDLEYDKDD